MPIDEVMERLTIEFPRVITPKEAEVLLKRLAIELSVCISYKPSQYKNIIPNKDQVHVEEGTSEISGSIRSNEDLEYSDCFLFEHSGEDTSKLKKIMFTKIPGYDELSEYGTKVIQLWDDARRIITNYFKQTTSYSNQS